MIYQLKVRYKNKPERDENEWTCSPCLNGYRDYYNSDNEFATYDPNIAYQYKQAMDISGKFDHLVFRVIEASKC